MGWLKRSNQLMLMMLAAGGLDEMQRSADAHDAGRPWASSNTAPQLMLAPAADGLVETQRSADAHDAGRRWAG